VLNDLGFNETDCIDVPEELWAILVEEDEEIS
jgi:hypothetical protein